MQPRRIQASHGNIREHRILDLLHSRHAINRERSIKRDELTDDCDGSIRMETALSSSILEMCEMEK